MPLIKFRKGGIQKGNVKEKLLSTIVENFNWKSSIEKADWNPCYWLTTADTTSNPPSKHLDSAMLEQNNPSATGPNVVVLPTIEDLYLPARFQRRPIDEKEIAYINVGILFILLFII